MISSQVWCVFVLVYTTVAVLGVRPQQDGTPQPASIGADGGVNDVQDNVAASSPSPTDIVKQMLFKRCSRQYSMTCLKLDLARLLDRLSSSAASYQILPGVSVISHNTTKHEEFPAELVKALARDNKSHQQKLDSFLVHKVNNYLSSLTLSVKLLDPTSLVVAKDSAEDSETEEGRRRKNNGMTSTLATAGLFSGGTLMAVGMSALAALAGKAMMTALLSLMLSAISALKGNGDSGHKSTTYEIVTRPVVSHAHTHSAEIQHDSHVPHGYGYGRSMEFNPVMPVVPQPDDSQPAEDASAGAAHQLAYRAHAPSSPSPVYTEQKE